MSEAGWRECKRCGQQFYVSQRDARWENLRRPGDFKWTTRIRCDRCLPAHRERNRYLAQPNWSIPNKQGLDGCYEECTLADISEIDGWYKVPLTGSQPVLDLSESISLNYHRQFTLLAPEWVHQPVSFSPRRIVYPWSNVIDREHGDRPEVVKFTVNERVRGVAWLRNLSKGLTVWRLDYAPRVSEDDPDVDLSLPFYAIAESIRRGQRGKVLFRPHPQYQTLLDRLHCYPTRDGQLLELTEQQAWREVMRQHGVSPDVVEELIRQDALGQADVAWIVEQLGRHSLAPRRIEGLTCLATGLNWLDIKRLAINRLEVSQVDKAYQRRALRHVMAALLVREMFEGSGKVSYTPQQNAIGQLIDYMGFKDVQYWQFSSVLGRTVRGERRMRASDKMLVIARAWSIGDYDSLQPEQTIEQLAQSQSLVPWRYLAVSRDFWDVQRERREAIIRLLTDQDARLLILDYTVEEAKADVKDLYSRLDYTKMSSVNADTGK